MSELVMLRTLELELKLVEGIEVMLQLGRNVWHGTGSSGAGVALATL